MCALVTSALGAKNGSEVKEVEAGYGLEIIGLEVTFNHKNITNCRYILLVFIIIIGAAWKAGW